MRIESFWARGYRSLRDVRIDGLGPFNVLYGPNGAGKSNILSALDALFAAMAVKGLGNWEGPNDWDSGVEPDPALTRVPRPRDYNVWSAKKQIVLGARLTGWPADAHSFAFEELEVEVTYDERCLRFSRLQIPGGADFLAARRLPPKPLDAVPGFSRLPLTERAGFEDTGMACLDLGHELQRVAEEAGFALIPEDRLLSPESSNGDHEHTVVDLLNAGRLKEALLRASTHSDYRVRNRVALLQRLLQGPPLARPAFVATQDPTGEYQIREVLPDPNPEGRDVELDLAGLGIAQVYAILAQIIIRDARAIGIEEPEAHLHAPTTGRHLRALLKRVVDEGMVDQLFIATHSNLFDLDSNGYFDVSFDPERGTVVERKSLEEIDRLHLYEPGPAKHAIQASLSYLEPEVTVFRRADGTPVSAEEMLRLLQEDDDVAVEYLRDVHGAAVRAVRVAASRE